MRTFMKRALWGAAIAGGLTLLGASAANAAETGGEEGILSGSQVEAPLSLPVTILDNAISVLGGSSVAAPAEAAPAPEPAPAPAPEPAPATTDGSNGVGSGTQALVDVTVPVTVGGNAIAVLGEAESSGTDAGTTAAPASSSPATTTGDGGVLSGTQGLISADVPITVSGNSIAVLGGSTVNGATADATPAAPGATDGNGTDGATTGGQGSVLGGTQLLAPITVPVTIGGNAISLLGESSVSGGDAGGNAPATQGTDLLAPLTSGTNGLLGGTQLAVPISVPLTIGGNGIAILGESVVTGSGPAPGVDPGTVPGTDPGTNPGPVPGVTPGAVGTVVPAAVTAATGMLTTTGGIGMIPLALVALGLLASGGVLLRRRAA